MENVKSELLASFDQSQVSMEQSGSHVLIHMIWQGFDGLRALKRQQAVYAVIQPWITSGELHAVTIKAETPEEHEQKKSRGLS